MTGAINGGALKGAPTVATYGLTSNGLGTDGVLAATGNTALALRGVDVAAEGFAI